MNASIVDLRYKTREILKALERRESVNILYRGKIKAIISPAEIARKERLSQHPFFGSAAKGTHKVAEIMRNLRGGRYNAL